MEHEHGSGLDPAAPGMPDEMSSQLPAEGAETTGPADPREPTDPADMARASEAAAASEMAGSDVGGVSEPAPASEQAPASETASASETAPASETAARSDAEESDASQETRQATGEPRVDAALGRLGELDELQVSEHPRVYERVHEQLVDVLGELHQGTQNS